MKKYLALFLTLALTLSMAAIPTMAEERETIRVAILDRSAVPTEQGTYEDNWATRWINENSPVAVEFVPVTRSSTYSTYNLWLAGGEAPDLIMEFQPEYVEEWANLGLLHELHDLIDEYMPSYRTLTSEDAQKWGYIGDDEYAIIQERPETSVINHMVYVRTDWLENLGLSMPTNWEEFENVVRAFTEDDPDGNGVNDTWGWSLAGHYQTAIQSMYGVANTNWYKNADGTFDSAYVMEERLEAQKFLEKCIDNGWADVEYLSYDSETPYTQFATVKTGFLVCEHANLYNKAYKTLKANFPDATVAVMPSFTEYGYYQERECAFLNVIPSTCKNPAAVLQYLEWMITDGWEMVTRGVEGEDYQMIDGAAVTLLDTDAYKAKFGYTQEYAVVRHDTKSGTIAAARVAAENDPDPIMSEGKMIDCDAMEKTKDIKFRRDTPTANLGVEEVIDYMTDLNTVAGEYYAKALADKDYTSEQAYEDIKAEWENMDYEMIKEAFNEKAAELGL